MRERERERKEEGDRGRGRGRKTDVFFSLLKTNIGVIY